LFFRENESARCQFPADGAGSVARGLAVVSTQALAKKVAQEALAAHIIALRQARSFRADAAKSSRDKGFHDEEA